MTSFREPQSTATPSPLTGLKLSIPLPPPLAISVITGPVLGLLVSGRMVAQALTQLGVSSEELFRGDRLPTLPALPKNKEATSAQYTESA